MKYKKISPCFDGIGFRCIKWNQFAELSAQSMAERIVLTVKSAYNGFVYWRWTLKGFVATIIVLKHWTLRGNSRIIAKTFKTFNKMNRFSHWVNTFTRGTTMLSFEWAVNRWNCSKNIYLICGHFSAFANIKSSADETKLGNGQCGIVMMIFEMKYAQKLSTKFWFIFVNWGKNRFQWSVIQLY